MSNEVIAIDVLRPFAWQGKAPIGLLAFDVAINWPEVGVGPLDPPTAPDNIEVMLHDLGHDYLLLDLDFPGTSNPWLEPGRTYRIGTPASGIDMLVPRQHYRGLFYLETSPMMTSLDGE